MVLVVQIVCGIGFPFAVPSRVGFRAKNTVGTLVGFSTSLSPNQRAYTKVGQDKVVGCRLRITPNLCYIVTIIPLPARDILRIFQARGHFMQVGVYKLSTLSDS